MIDLAHRPPALGQAHILIVDDEEPNVDVIERILQEAGYQHLAGVTDSRQAVARCAEFQPDLVILDLRMPHLDGFKILERIRAQAPPEVFLPILVLTSDPSPEARRRALTCGASDFLTRPLDTSEIILRVWHLLSTRILQAELARQNQDLEAQVALRTAELERANQELRESEARLKLLISSMEEIAVEVDREGLCLRFWAGDRNLAPLPAGPRVGHSLPEIFGPEAGRLLREGTVRALATGRPETLEHTLTLTSGERWFLTRIAPLADSAGNLQTVCLLARDITHRKRNEQQLRLAVEEAERANSAKTNFLSRMSHELRTPLNAILGFAQLIERDGLTEEDRDGVDQIVGAGKHLLGLINEVLDMARIEVGRLTLSLDRVACDEVMAEVFGLVRPLAAEHQVTLGEIDCPAEVLADRLRLRQVLLNLYSNAIKYNRPGGSVRYSCSRHDGQLRIAVSDTGWGIPRGRMDQLFRPFERLENSPSSVEGIGLGLAISKRLVELMGGSIGVESEEERGSTFWISLPLVRETPALLPIESSAPAIQENPPCTVLYIEDNLSNLKLVERLLQIHPNLHLLAATHGFPGLELAARHLPVLILLDLHLPDVSGPEVLERLRADPRTAEVPVIVTSADPAALNAHQLPPGTFQGFLAKPFDVREFDTTLRAVLGDRLPAEPDARAG